MLKPSICPRSEFLGTTYADALELLIAASSSICLYATKANITAPALTALKRWRLKAIGDVPQIVYAVTRNTAPKHCFRFDQYTQAETELCRRHTQCIYLHTPASLNQTNDHSQDTHVKGLTSS